MNDKMETGRSDLFSVRDNQDRHNRVIYEADLSLVVDSVHAYNSGISQSTLVAWRELGMPRRNFLLQDYLTTRIRLFDAVVTLSDARTVMVDDQPGVVADYIPILQSVTNGKSDFVLYDKQSINDLVASVLEKAPEIVLMDYFLNGNQADAHEYSGADVIKAMRAQSEGPQPIVIGFSADTMLDEFARAGANGVVTKYSTEIIEGPNEVFYPYEGSIIRLSEIIRDLRRYGANAPQKFSSLSFAASSQESTRINSLAMYEITSNSNDA